MKFTLRDNQRIGSPPIGTLELFDGYGPVEIANLVRSGWLAFQTILSDADLKIQAEEQLKNESRLAKIQAEIDAEASKIPTDKYELADLTGKQLKALCKKHGLEATGNKFDMIDRIEKSVLNGGETAAQKVSKSKK